MSNHQLVIAIIVALVFVAVFHYSPYGTGRMPVIVGPSLGGIILFLIVLMIIGVI